MENPQFCVFESQIQIQLIQEDSVNHRDTSKQTPLKALRIEEYEPMVGRLAGDSQGQVF